MGQKDLDDLVAETVKRKPQFESSIDRMYKVTKALNNSNVDSAFRRYLKKIASSDDAEGARFVTEMERYVYATQSMLKTLDSTDIDRDEVVTSHFPQPLKIIKGLFFFLTGLVVLILFLFIYLFALK